MRHRLFAGILLTVLTARTCATQESERSDTTPTAVQWTIDAAGPTQRTAIKSVVLLYCPNTNNKGTGFLLREGLIVTNNHVVEGCTAAEMQANPFGGQAFGFS